MVRFGKFNIQNGQNRGLKSALHGLDQGQIDCVILQETKLTNRFYTQEARDFWVMSKEAPSAHRSGVAIFYPEADHFAIKELRLHGLNVISFQMVTGRCWWHVMGCYISPGNDSTIEDVDTAIRDQPYGSELLVAGDFNINLVEPEGTPQGEAVADELAAAGLIDIVLHFLTWRKPWL